LILDNASYHKCKKVREWLRKYPEIMFACLPAYSPEYSPIEQFWKWLKKEIGRFQTVFSCLKEKVSAIRKITWGYREKRLVNMPNIGIGVWSALL